MPFWRVFYHLVWGTKGRCPMIDDERATTLRTSVISVSHEHKALVHAVGIMPDHIHIAVSIPPSVAVSKVVQGMKGRSSYHINLNRNDELGEFAWQPEYGLISFGERALPDVVAYIRNQRQHHAERTLRPYLEQMHDLEPTPKNVSQS
jgi:putative transposase